MVTRLGAIGKMRSDDRNIQSEFDVNRVVERASCIGKKQNIKCFIDYDTGVIIGQLTFFL